MDAMSTTPTALSPETSAPQTSVAKTWTRDTDTTEKRDLWTAMKRGFRGRCPRCGEGKLFRAFLKVADHCDHCGQDFSGHRADDLPAYLVIVIVGHIEVPIALYIETNYSPSVALQLAIYLPVTFFASLGLLQPVKHRAVDHRFALRIGSTYAKDSASLL